MKTIPMQVCIRILIDVEVPDGGDEEEAEEILRNMDDSELWAIAKYVDYEYDVEE